MAEPFWRALPLESMSHEQWESLCDGCARCCVEKLEDEDTGEVYYTNVACALLDTESCRCRDYERRTDSVPECVALDARQARTLTWLPPTCAYRRLAEGRDLPPWHPLVSGDPGSVAEAGISAHGWLVNAEEVEDIEDHLIEWANSDD